MELGSEYYLDLNDLSFQQDNVLTYLKGFSAIYTDSGRSAIKLLLSSIECHSILLPNYICDSVINAIPKHYTIHFYPIHTNFTLDIPFLENQLDSGVSILYIMNYFGNLLSSDVQATLLYLKKKHNLIIIEDTTHSFLSATQTVGDYCICSLRKWFPIPDGGVLYSKTNLDFILTHKLPPKPLGNKLTALILKNLYLQNKLNCHDLYRSIFVAEEELLASQSDIFGISFFSYDLLKYFSISSIKNRRKKNYDQLYRFILEFLPEYLVFTTQSMVPFSFPLFISGRDLLRNYLIDHNIYCAVHWPLSNTPLINFSTSIEISKKIISLPIDQRYDTEHMEYLIITLKTYFNI